MRILNSFLALVFVASSLTASAQTNLDSLLTGFSYENRKEMKITSQQIVELLEEEKAVLVDIRFKEEQESWQINHAIKMPLPVLPQNYRQLPKNKLIVTASPHKDRAIIAMLYLRSKGYRAAYLKEGMLGLAEYLRGDRAKAFILQLNDKN